MSNKQLYTNLIDSFSKQLQKRGVSYKHLDNGLRHPLDQLSEEEALQNIEFIQAMIEQYEVLDPTQSKSDSARSIVLHNSMVPTDPSVFGKIKEDDFVEIVDLKTFAATYRCTQTFKMTNYSVEELLTYSSLVLFDRPSWVTTEILKLLKDIQQWPRLIDMSHFPTYLLQETMSLVGTQFLITHKYVCPLIKVGESTPSAVLSTFHFEECNTDDSGDIRIL